MSEQSFLAFLPFILLVLLMLHSMMEFTVSLLARNPKSNRKPISAGELRRRLLGLNEPDKPFRLVPGVDSDLQAVWEQVERASPARFASLRSSSTWRVRLLLDERRHQVRINQTARSYYFAFTFAGWLPNLRAAAGAESGPPGYQLMETISRIAHQGGWGVRPVLWWFQATHRGYHALEALTPAPMRTWSGRRFWGLLYPATFALAIGYFWVIGGPFELRESILVAGISAVWWGVWGSLAWVLWRKSR